MASTTTDQSLLATRLAPAPSRGAPATAPAPAALPPQQRLALVPRHRDHALWMQRSPRGIPEIAQLAFRAVVGLAIVGVALSQVLRASAAHDLGDVVRLGFALFGVVFAGYSLYRLARFLGAPIERRAARVLEEHVERRRVRHGHATYYYATFEFEDGMRSEYLISRRQAAEIERDDVGVAITRDTVLLEYHRAA